MKFPCQSILVLLVAALFSSCGKEEIEKIVVVEKPAAEISRKDINSAWGLPFEFRPINQADERLREWGKATVFIRYIEGSGATGFFISEDGLLLTNEHVISRSDCTDKRCSGMQLIRDFRVGGELEVFTEFELLVSNTDLDFSLVKVRLPEGRKVPYLKLSKERVGTTDSLALLGYPGGASLHVSSSKLNRFRSSRSSDFLSISVGGNSGSPIINTATGEVVAIHSASSRRDERIDRQGNVSGYGKGTVSEAIINTVRIVNPKFYSSSVATWDESSVLGRGTSPRIANLRPRTELAELTYGAFFRGSYFSERRISDLVRLTKSMEGNLFDTASKEDLYGSLVFADLASNTKTVVTQAMLLEAFKEKQRIPSSVLIQYLNEGSEGCRREKEKNFFQDPVAQYYFSSQDCLTSDPLLLSRIYRVYGDKNWGNEPEGFPSLLAMGISGQLAVSREIPPENIRNLQLTMLKKIAEEGAVMRHYFQADGLFTLLQEKPSLLIRGSFAQKNQSTRSEP